MMVLNRQATKERKKALNPKKSGNQIYQIIDINKSDVITFILLRLGARHEESIISSANPTNANPIIQNTAHTDSLGANLGKRRSEYICVSPEPKQTSIHTPINTAENIIALLKSTQ